MREELARAVIAERGVRRESAASGPERVSTASASTVTVQDATHGVPATIRSSDPRSARSARCGTRDAAGRACSRGTGPRPPATRRPPPPAPRSRGRSVDALVMNLYFELLGPAAITAQPGPDRRSFRTLHTSPFYAPPRALPGSGARAGGSRGLRRPGADPRAAGPDDGGDFGRATADKDYKTLCDRILAPKLVEDVTSVGLSCEAALKRGLGNVREPRLTIGSVRIDGDNATAEIRTSASGRSRRRTR